MKTNFSDFENKANLKVWNDFESLKKNPDFISPIVLEGTHVMCLPNDKYLKKYWNMIAYVSINTDNSYDLYDMSYVGGLSNKRRLEKCGKNSPIFGDNAKPGVDFEWLENGVVYNQFCEELRKY